MNSETLTNNDKAIQKLDKLIYKKGLRALKWKFELTVTDAKFIYIDDGIFVPLHADFLHLKTRSTFVTQRNGFWSIQDGGLLLELKGVK